MSVAGPDERIAQRSARRRRRFALGAAAVLVGVFVMVAAAFWFSGGRWFVVRTPSMGTAAPVGTLVLTRPTTVGALHVGDVIAFHPPNSSETYTHRIVEIVGGSVRTRGDINGIADPWLINNKEIVGHATIIVPRLGWLFRALPLLLIGGLLLWGLTRFWVRPERRGPARMLGVGLLFMTAALILKPFIGVAQLANTTSPDGVSRITLVSTGLLPVRLTPAQGHGHGAPVDLRSGQVGVSVLHGAPSHGHFQLGSHLHLHWTQWILAIAISLLPLLWTVIVGYRPVPVSRHAAHPVSA